MTNPYSRRLFLDKLIPQYIREEYPLFLNFLKEYYNYLDRTVGQIIAVTVSDQGKNYSSSPVVQLRINGLADTSSDPAQLEAYVSNGRLEKILVTNYGSGYDTEDEVTVYIQDSTGTGAAAEPIIVRDLGNVNPAVVQVLSSRDIDQEVALLTTFLENEYIPTFPAKLYSSTAASVEVEKFVKFIKQFYNSAGIENSIRFLYRILFNTTVDFYYPKTDMLRVSDGRWNIDRKIYLSSSIDYLTFRDQYVGKRILEESGATAIIEAVDKITVSTVDYIALTISNINGTFNESGSKKVYNYPITGIQELLGSTYVYNGKVLTLGQGYYLSDEGQPSSRKRIQDSTYYQDFSYELQSEESIKSFKNVVENLFHPAGLRYFIKITLSSAAALDEQVLNNETNIINFADEEFVSELSPSAYSLGPINLDIDLNKAVTYPVPYVDFTSTALVSLVSQSTVDISDAASFSNNSDEYLNFSVIITEGSNTFYRYVTAYNTSTKVITLDSAFTPSSSPITYRLIQNYRIASMDYTNKKMTLSSLDPMRYIPFTNNVSSVLSASTTASTGATGIVLDISDTLNVKVGDVIQVDSEKMTVNWTKGATGVLNLSVTRAASGTSVASHTKGATAYNTTDHRYLGWRIYITSGPAAGQFGKVTAYGATGVLTYSTAYTLHASGATAPTTNSTYYLLPDFAGATGAGNDGYYTTGSTGISSINVSNGGSGYVTGAGYGVRVDITAPIGATGTGYAKAAGATATVVSGVITAVTVYDAGKYYLFAPNVTFTQLGATGILRTAYAYASLNNTNSPSSDYMKFSELGGTVLYIPSGATAFVPAKASVTLQNKTTRLTTAMDSTGIYIRVQSSSVLNAFDVVQIENEKLLLLSDYDNVQNAFKVLRGYNGTTAAAHSSGMLVEVVGSTQDARNVLRSVVSCDITTNGNGYFSSPRVYFTGGEGTGAAASSTVTNGQVSNIVMTNAGSGYISAPMVEIEEPGIKSGDRVIQLQTTGATGIYAMGTVDYWDRSANLLYIKKDFGSPDFDYSTINYNGINIPVSGATGIVYYKTTGKAKNSLPESEINII